MLLSAQPFLGLVDAPGAVVLSAGAANLLLAWLENSDMVLILKNIYLLGGA